jgi:methylphosphotriester-DNA--protein-cysteine methyltransferase
VTVQWLARQANLSISQLERGFTRLIGVGPKLLARQTRVCALAAEAVTPTNRAGRCLPPDTALPTRRTWCASSAN